MSLPRFDYGDYTIGWICALPKEMTAAMAMLDETHENLPQPASDHNNYGLGSMGEFNIAIASLPSGEIGSHLASAVATRMLATFPKLRIGLMVGIGGGVPSKENDIRLGDVVVSVPANGFGGVVQHDMGKNTNYGGWVRTGSLNGPPPVLRTTISKLTSLHQIRGHKIESYMSDMIQRHPHLHPRYTRQETSTDVLYEPEPEDPNAFRGWIQVERAPRQPHETIQIHYGLIASGNQVIKSGRLRDQISSRYGGVLCFEMEAAGLMNELPCVVIRGICDYADAHKNKQWQEYAAAVAAAYAKELITALPVAVPERLAFRGIQAIVLDIPDQDPLATGQNEALADFFSDFVTSKPIANMIIRYPRNGARLGCSVCQKQTFCRARAGTCHIARMVGVRRLLPQHGRLRSWRCREDSTCPRVRLPHKGAKLKVLRLLGARHRQFGIRTSLYANWPQLQCAGYRYKRGRRQAACQGCTE